MTANSRSAGGPPASDERPGVLVIGYGSTLRGDDAVGVRVAEALEALDPEGVDVIVCHQLTPELSDPISRAARVIFVDAAIDLPDENVRVSRIEPEGEHQVMVHTASPQGLLQMAKSIFLAEPEAWLVAIPVAETGIGESLTPMALRGVEEATRKVLELVG